MQDNVKKDVKDVKDVALIVTTISEPNDIMKALADGARVANWNFIVIGDKKGPNSFELEGARFFDLKSQTTLGFSYAKDCPIGHYARKNIGYLIAMSKGTEIIVETDDDNDPYQSFFSKRERKTKALTTTANGWVNIYGYFQKESNIWPRGFPLRYVHSSLPEISRETGLFFSPIQQGLANENPDVDAIYRLVGKLPVDFKNMPNVALIDKQYCPYNSQNTTTFKEAFPLLYLPSHCSFRMTDIWRSFIAQRICHAFDWPIVFTRATVTQKRNDHDLMEDFRDEIDGYLYNEAIVDILNETKLSDNPSNRGITDNLFICYESLVKAGYFDERELNLLHCWIEDINVIYQY